MIPNIDAGPTTRIWAGDLTCKGVSLPAEIRYVMDDEHEMPWIRSVTIHGRHWTWRIETPDGKLPDGPSTCELLPDTNPPE